MLTTLELISALFGWLAMGFGIQLFIPEFQSFFKDHVGKTSAGNPKPPAEISPELFGFFTFWLIGDAAQLIALLVVGHINLTQVLLYVIVAVAESVFLTLLLVWAGYCCCMRHHRDIHRANLIKRNHNRSALYAGLRAMQDGNIHRLPPKYRDIRVKIDGKTVDGQIDGKDWRGDLNGLWKKHVQGQKAIADEKARAANRNSWKWLVRWLVIFVTVFTAIWFGKDFAHRETSTPPHVSKRPEEPKEIAAWYVAWFGLACWAGPRFFNIGRSLYYKRPEGITTQGVLIGALAHLANIGSVVLINNHGDALYAQLPFICTSAVCIGADVVRLILKFVFRKGEPLPPWASFFGLFGNGEEYDPFHKPKKEGRRKRDIIRGRQPPPASSGGRQPPPASSSDLETGGHASSDLGHSDSGSDSEEEDRRRHIKELQKAALLPWIPVTKSPSDHDHYDKQRLLAAGVNKEFFDKYNDPHARLSALHRASEADKKRQLRGERQLDQWAREAQYSDSDTPLHQDYHDVLRGHLDREEERRRIKDADRRREAEKILKNTDPEHQKALRDFNDKHFSSSDDDDDARELRARQNDPLRPLPLNDPRRPPPPSDAQRIARPLSSSGSIRLQTPEERGRVVNRQWLEQHKADQAERLEKEREEWDRNRNRPWYKKMGRGGATSSGSESA